MEGWTSVFRDDYDPLKAGSIDATDTEPHDRAIVRAMNAKYKPNKFVVGDPLKTVFVARLNPKTNEEKIETVFSLYGMIKRFRLVRDIVTGFSKGYAFIEYSDQHGADCAQRKANKLEIDGCEIFVDFECERTLKEWVPRRLGGGLGGRKESGQLRFGGLDRPFRKPIFDHSGGDNVKRISENMPGRYDDRRDRRDVFSDRGHFDKSRDLHRISSHNKDSRKYSRESNREDYRSRDRSRDRGRDYKQEKSRDRKEDRYKERKQESKTRDYSPERSRKRSRDRSRKGERSREDKYRSENKYTREQTAGRNIDNQEISRLINKNIKSIWDNEQSHERSNLDMEYDDKQ